MKVYQVLQDTRPGSAAHEDARLSVHTVLVWKLDRFDGRCLASDQCSIVRPIRRSVHHLTENVEQIPRVHGRLMLHLFAAFAEFERNLIENVSALVWQRHSVKGIHCGVRLAVPTR